MFFNKKRINLQKPRRSSNETFMVPRQQYNTRTYNQKEVLKQSQRVPDIKNALDKIVTKTALAEFVLSKKNRLGELKKIGSTQDVIFNDDISFIMKPNIIQDFATFWKVNMWYRRTCGQFMILLDDGKDLMQPCRKLKQIWAVNPSWVSMRPSSNTDYFIINMNNSYSVNVHKDNVIEYGSPDMENPYQTFFGFTQSLSDEIAIVEKSSVEIATYFENSMTPPSIIGIEGANKEVAKIMKTTWIEKFRGFGKKHIPFFAPFKVSYNKLSSEWKDMQLKELRADEREYIQRSFDVVQNLDKANRSTAQVVLEKFYQDQILPYLKEICLVYNMYILPAYKKENKLYMSFVDPTPPDKELQMELLKNHKIIATAERIAAIGGFKLKEYEDPTAILLSGTDIIYSEDKKTITDSQGKQYKLQKKDLKKIKQTDEAIEVVLNSIINEEYNAQEVYDDVIDEYINLMQTEGNKELTSLGIEQFFNIKNPEAVQFLRDNVGQNITFISSTYQNFLRKGISDGVDQGLGINAILELMKDRNIQSYTTVVDDNALKRIIRTETHNAFQETKLQSWKQSKIVPYKQWLTAKDERVRDWHSVIDGEITGINEEFQSGLGNYTLRPGGFGVSNEDIACRCTCIPKFDKKKQLEYEDVKNAELEEMENILIDYEKTFGKAYENALNNQFEKIIKRMEEINV